MHASEQGEYRSVWFPASGKPSKLSWSKNDIIVVVEVIYTPKSGHMNIIPFYSKFMGNVTQITALTAATLLLLT